MTVGAEPKKIAILGGLLLVAAYFLYTNLKSSPSGSETPRPAAKHSSAPASVIPPESVSAPVRSADSRRGDQEFRPSFKHKGVDPSTIDPNLRLDLLTKVRSVELGPAARNLFAFGAAPPPTIPGGRTVGPIHPNPVKPATPVTEIAASATGQPPPPPITLKYYGYTSRRSDGRKRAFFTEGDCKADNPTSQCDIFVAAEGELILKRYKVVKIGVSSAEVEDTQFNHSQPLPIAQESPG